MMTLSEAAIAYGMKIRVIRYWLAKGKIKGVKQPNGRWLIPEEEMDRMAMQRSERKKHENES